MTAAAKGAPPQWMSTHPSGKSRIQLIKDHLKDVQPLYERAKAAKSAGTSPDTWRKGSESPPGDRRDERQIERAGRFRLLAGSGAAIWTEAIVVRIEFAPPHAI